MNKFIVFFVCAFNIFTPFTYHLSGAQPQNQSQTKQSETSTQGVNCSPQLQKTLQAILKIPEAINLINSIRKEGTISIVAKNNYLSKQFGAVWDPDQRVIYIEVSSDRTEGTLIGFLLFELHNASVNYRIKELNNMASRGEINKEKYVESMEYLEYINSLNASRIAQIGIRMGALPWDSHLPTYNNFEDHFNAQKMSGHSDCFARNYDMCL